ncbi:MAG: dUTP diphosphatase [Eubacteriales bacterium]
MYEIHVKFKRLKAAAKPPAYQTDGSAACDLSACLDQPVTLQPGQSALIPTGIALSPDAGDEPVALLIYARSGLAVRHGIALSNGVGVVDSDYRGEIMVGLINQSAAPYTISSGERIAQMMVTPIRRAVFTEADALDETARGSGGFGSTGVR